MAKLTVTRPKVKFSAILVDVLDKAVIPVAKEKAESTANDMRQELIDKIKSNNFNFAPLSEKYAKSKSKDYPGNPPLIRTEQYINSIEVQETKNGFTVGVADSVHFGDVPKNSDSNPDTESADTGTPIMMRDLARWLEYGLPEQNLPARPHWRPIYQKYRKKQMKNLTQDQKNKMKEEADKILKQYLKTNLAKNARS